MKQNTITLNSGNTELSGFAHRWQKYHRNWYGTLSGKTIKAKESRLIFLAVLGSLFFNIRRDHSDFDAAYFADATDITVQLAEDDKQTLPRFRIVIPGGAGVRYNLSESFVVNVESTIRFPFTDYLDGFSRAANPEHKDHYHSIMVGVIYRTGNKSNLACPVIKY